MFRAPEVHFEVRVDFAREETKENLRGAGPVRRHWQALAVAMAAYFIVTSMWNEKVYANVGLDTGRALREAAANEHHKALLRSSCAGLMEFLGSCGLLTKPALYFYRRANLI